METILDLLIQLEPTKSKSELRRLCQQGAVTIYDPPGWGVLPDDQMRVLDADITFEEIYGRKTELPNRVKIGKRKVFDIHLSGTENWQEWTDDEGNVYWGVKP